MLLGVNCTSSTLDGPYEYASCGRGQTDAVMSAYGRPERPEVPQEGPGGGLGGANRCVRYTFRPLHVNLIGFSTTGARDHHN